MKNKGFLGDREWKSIVIFRAFTSVTFHSTCIINIATFGTLPILRSRDKTTRRTCLIAFFTILSPIKIRKRTFTTQPIMIRILIIIIIIDNIIKIIFIIFLFLSWSWFLIVIFKWDIKMVKIFIWHFVHYWL
jgi:hypothetical protein